MNDRLRIFQKLGKPPRPLGVLSVEIDLAKRECRVGFIYDAFNDELAEGSLFHLRFVEVSNFEWFVTDETSKEDVLPSDVVYVLLGDGLPDEPCIVATINYGFKVHYGSLHIEA